MTIFESLSNSKNMVFNEKKLQDDDVGLMLRQRDGKKQSQRHERQILRIQLPMVSFH
jgi:hypothetical protein